MPTIVPITAEAEWLSALGDLPAWDPPLVPTVIVAPHPDDETLGAGGLIARLRGKQVPVAIVAITDGENAYADAAGLRECRVDEQVEALRRLGVSASMIYRLRLPDRDVALYEEMLMQLLRPLFSDKAHVVAPWPRDFHPDHEAAGRAAERVALEMGLTLSFYLFWTWHRSTPIYLKGLPLVALPLSGAESRMKLHALAAHESQLAHLDGQPILSADLLEPARRTFEVYIH